MQSYIASVQISESYFCMLSSYVKSVVFVLVTLGKSS